MEFFIRLKDIRKQKGTSQTELANFMLTKQQTISKWEKGILEPSYKDLKKIALYFDVSADYLIGLVDEFGNPTKGE